LNVRVATLCLMRSRIGSQCNDCSRGLALVLLLLCVTTRASMHAIRILRSRGMGDAQLQLVYCAVVVAKLTYASSSWWGFNTASDRQRLEDLLRRGCRQNLYSTDKPSITKIVEEADENLFNSIRYKTSHLLHQLLPRRTESSYSLRSRPHDFELSHIHDDRNFIDRMLFYPYHNA